MSLKDFSVLMERFAWSQMVFPMISIGRSLLQAVRFQFRRINKFLKYIFTYNNTFACTSFGVKYDQNFCKRNKCIYTFRVQGQVYHYINDLLPSNDHPSYLQLYFFDSEHEVEIRLYNSDRLNISILTQIRYIKT